jgi:hypothetical protein
MVKDMVIEISDPIRSVYIPIYEFSTVFTMEDPMGQCKYNIAGKKNQ